MAVNELATSHCTLAFSCNSVPATGWNLRSSFQFANQLVMSVGMVLMTFSLIMTSADTYTLMCSLRRKEGCEPHVQTEIARCDPSRQSQYGPTTACCQRTQGAVLECRGMRAHLLLRLPSYRCAYTRLAKAMLPSSGPAVTSAISVTTADSSDPSETTAPAGSCREVRHEPTISQLAISSTQYTLLLPQTY